MERSGCNTVATEQQPSGDYEFEKRVLTPRQESFRYSINEVTSVHGTVKLDEGLAPRIASCAIVGDAKASASPSRLYTTFFLGKLGRAVRLASPILKAFEHGFDQRSILNPASQIPGCFLDRRKIQHYLQHPCCRHGLVKIWLILMKDGISTTPLAPLRPGL